MSVQAGDMLAAAEAAFAEGDWARARDLFEAAVRAELSGEALDGLSRALWWLGRTEEAAEARARAFAEHQRAGHPTRAAAAATHMAAEYRIAGNASLSNGWLRRAMRLLEGAGECAELAWLHVELSKRATSPPEAGRHAAEAVRIAVAARDIDVEASARSHLGLALISQGRVSDGLEVLDEAMAIAMGGEPANPLAVSDACCATLVACERVADPRRARDWSRAISDFMRRRNFTPLYAWCRSIYAGFLVATGRWDDAERELQEALREAARIRGSDRLAPLVRLADLRVRQGRLEEAEQLLSGCEQRPAAIEPVVRLHIARGRLGAAAEALAQRAEAVAGSDALLAPLLALQAEVELARGDGTAARACLGRLRTSAAAAAREDLLALADVREAHAARLAGERPDCAAVEAALERLHELDMPFHEAVGRLELARALRAHGRERLAVEQARAALGALEALGAAPHADETAGLLRDLGAPGRSAPRTGSALTRREQEVLRLLGEGLSNGEIAARLVISPKTVEHHVGRVLSKLGLRNRAEAAAYVARVGVAAPS